MNDPNSVNSTMWMFLWLNNKKGTNNWEVTGKNHKLRDLLLHHTLEDYIDNNVAKTSVCNSLD